MLDNNDISIVATVKIKKFNEDQNVISDEPFEILDKQIKLVGADAQKLIDAIGGKEDVNN